MTMPASVHQEHRAALNEIYTILRAAALRARQQAAPNPPATETTEEDRPVPADPPDDAKRTTIAQRTAVSEAR